MLRDVSFDGAAWPGGRHRRPERSGQEHAAEDAHGNHAAHRGPPRGCAGRIAAILELGMGFHAEFTGRQNVRHGGRMMGSRAQLEAAMPAIESSPRSAILRRAGAHLLERHEDARGLQRGDRLPPDILIVDEALSVGDAYFQHKSFERIRAVPARGHHAPDRVARQAAGADAVQPGDPAADAAAWRSRASPAGDGLLQRADRRAREHAGLETRAHESRGAVQTVSGTGEAHDRLGDAARTRAARTTDAAKVGEEVVMSVRFRAHVDLPSLVVGRA